MEKRSLHVLSFHDYFLRKLSHIFVERRIMTEPASWYLHARHVYEVYGICPMVTCLTAARRESRPTGLTFSCPMVSQTFMNPASRFCTTGELTAASFSLVKASYCCWDGIVLLWEHRFQLLRCWVLHQLSLSLSIHDCVCVLLTR